MVGPLNHNFLAMEYDEVLDWLYQQLPMFQRTGPVRYRIDLAKTYALCAALGHPERGLNVIHIAGTNGKGSVSHAVAAAFTAQGPEVGLYTSPHLTDPRERIRINGHLISKSEFTAFVTSTRPFGKPTSRVFLSSCLPWRCAISAATQLTWRSWRREWAGGWIRPTFFPRHW